MIDPEHYDSSEPVGAGSLLLQFGLLSGRQEHTHRHDVTVHEHRAPTDASVRLLREMEQKMRERLLATYEVPTTYGTVVLHRLKAADMMGVGHQWIGRFNLNGRTFEVERRIKDLDTHRLSKWDALKHEAEVILRAVSEEIARVLLTEGLAHMDQTQLEG